MDTVGKLMKKHGVSATRAREMQREHRDAEWRAKYAREIAREVSGIARKENVSLEEAASMREQRERFEREAWATEVGLDTPESIQKLKRAKWRQAYWRRVEQTAVSAYAVRRGVAAEEIDDLLHEEYLLFRRTGEKPSFEYLRITGAAQGHGVEEHWKRLQERRKSRSRKSRRQKEARKRRDLLVSHSLREQVLKEEGSHCRYCGWPTNEPQVDHIMTELGSRRFNLTVACRSCNSDKADKNVLTWAKSQGDGFIQRVAELLTIRFLSRKCDRCGQVVDLDVDEVLCADCVRECDAA